MLLFYSFLNSFLVRHHLHIFLSDIIWCLFARLSVIYNNKVMLLYAKRSCIILTIPLAAWWYYNSTKCGLLLALCYKQYIIADSVYLLNFIRLIASLQWKLMVYLSFIHTLFDANKLFDTMHVCVWHTHTHTRTRTCMQTCRHTRMHTHTCIYAVQVLWKKNKMYKMDLQEGQLYI